MRSLNPLGTSYDIEWKNLILPASALAIRIIGIITQLTRSSVIAVIKQEFITYGKSQGVEFYSNN